jgi:glutamate synthase domain-containing protein 2
MSLSRYFLYIASLVLTVVFGWVTLRDPTWGWALIIAAGVAAIGTRRRAAEEEHAGAATTRCSRTSATAWKASARKMRQYFIESDIAETPFSRQQRALIYQRSKSVRDTRPFGTLHDVYSVDYEWINHSLSPAAIPTDDFRIDIGGDRVSKPYSASVFNISAMSWGALSAAAIRALNEGARRGKFYHDTGEGRFRRITWKTAATWCGRSGRVTSVAATKKGGFDPDKFAKAAQRESVRMIEVKLSQGAKPGHGGVLPGAKVTQEVADVRGVAPGVDCVSPAKHSAFSTPVGLLEFVAKLRELSGGKPTGFKLAIGHPWEWFGIAKAMQETGLLPDFIVVDGAKAARAPRPRNSSTTSACRCTKR